MDGVTVSVLGALAALAVAIVLILKKVQPTYAMIFGAVIGGLVGGAGLTGTVSFIISWHAGYRLRNHPHRYGGYSGRVRLLKAARLSALPSPSSIRWVPSGA